MNLATTHLKRCSAISLVRTAKRVPRHLNPGRSAQSPIASGDSANPDDTIPAPPFQSTSCASLTIANLRLRLLSSSITATTPTMTSDVSSKFAAQTVNYFAGTAYPPPPPPRLLLLRLLMSRQQAQSMLSLASEQ